jgi:hypothetical protein
MVPSYRHDVTFVGCVTHNPTRERGILWDFRPSLTRRVGTSVPRLRFGLGLKQQADTHRVGMDLLECCEFRQPRETHPLGTMVPSYGLTMVYINEVYLRTITRSSHPLRDFLLALQRSFRTSS